MLDVGDGACSVLRERSDVGDGLDRTAVIDCGSRPRRGELAARLLAAHLTPQDWRSLSQLVVTHFDADHWEGLLHVVNRIPSDSCTVPPDLCIYFPAVPFYVNPRLPEGLMTFITAVGPYGVQPLDLRAAWRRVTRVHMRPVAKGDSFPLADRLHEVVWPPARLTGRATQRLNTLVQRIEEEAAQLARLGYPQLQNSLREAYENGPYNRHPARDDGPSYDIPEFELPAFAANEYQETQSSLSGNSTDTVIPKERARSREFRNLVKRARAAQNDLSLVFHDPARASLLVFGDAPAAVVERVCPDLRADGYQVALAPHHGSRQLWSGAPNAETCISQYGTGLRQFWPNHTGSHFNSGNCINTYDSGDIDCDLL